MNHLFLLRHGKSDWSVNASDYDRPITDRGKRASQRMGVWLAQQKIKPQIIISSPANRAITTAEKMVKAMEGSADLIQIDNRLYHGSIEDFKAVLADRGIEGKAVILVGHNPAMEDFVNYLTKNRNKIPESNKIFPTAALAYFTFSAKWNSINKQTADLQQLKFAKNLEKKFPYPSAVKATEYRKRPAYYYQQSSVIPYRINKGKLEILLVLSSKKKHFVIPKGIIEPGLTAQQSAEKEAFEEAGVKGQIDNNFVGEYQYQKWSATCHVQVYPLKVTELIADENWQESHRGRHWIKIKEAKKKIFQAELKTILANFESYVADH